MDTQRNKRHQARYKIIMNFQITEHLKSPLEVIIIKDMKELKIKEDLEMDIK